MVDLKAENPPAPHPDQLALPFLTPPPVTVKGVTGLNRQGTRVYDEWHPQLKGTKGVKVYREMRDNDAVCGSIYYGADTQIRQTPWTIKAMDEEDAQACMIAKHVETCFWDMDSTMNEWLSDVNTAIWAGFSLHGCSYKVRRGPNAPLECLQSQYDDGLVGWRDLPIRAQETVQEWDFRDDGKVLGAFQMAPPKYQRTRLDMEKDELLLFRTVGNRGSPEGRSIYRNAWRSWVFLKRIQEFEAIGVERDLAGTLVFNLPVQYFLDGATSTQKATVEAYRQIGERARVSEQGCLVMPAEEQEGMGTTGFKASLLQAGGKRPMDVNEIVKRLESRILVSVLGEAVLLGMQGDAGSSRALHSSKTKLSTIVLRAWMGSIEDTINRHAIPRLVAANGWPVVCAPTFEFGDIESDDSGELASAITALVGAGVVKAGDELERYLRTRMGLPLEGEISDGQMQDAAGAMDESEKQEPPGAADLAAEVAAEKAVPIAEEQGTPSQTVTAQEASEILGVSRGTINRAIANGQLPGRKIGSQYRVMRQDLFNHMKGVAA